LERGAELDDFAIEGDGDVPAAGGDGGFGGGEDIKFADAAEPLEGHGDDGAEQAEAAGAAGDPDAELALVETGADAELEAFDLVGVVADEDEGGEALESLAVDGEADAEEGEAKEGEGGGEEEGGGFADAVALDFLALHDHFGVEAEAGVVEEDAAVDGADVDGLGGAGGEDGDGRGEVGGDAEVGGEVVEGAAGDDAEADGGADEEGGNGVEGTVAAGGDDDGAAEGEVGAEGGFEVESGGDGDDGAGETGFLQGGEEEFAVLREAEGSGVGIEDEDGLDEGEQMVRCARVGCRYGWGVDFEGCGR
jgi:hypothetical protein